MPDFRNPFAPAPQPGWSGADPMQQFIDPSALQAAQLLAAQMTQPQFVEPQLEQPGEAGMQSEAEVKLATIAELLSVLGAMAPRGAPAPAPIGTARAEQRGMQRQTQAAGMAQRNQVAVARADFQNRLSAAKYSDDLQTANDIRRERIRTDATEGIKQKQSEEAAFLDEVAADTARLGDMKPEDVDAIIGHYPSLAANPDRARMMAQSAIARGRLEATTRKRAETSASRAQEASDRAEANQERLRQQALLSEAKAYVAAKTASGEKFEGFNRFEEVFRLFPGLERNEAAYGALTAAEKALSAKRSEAAPKREEQAMRVASRRAQLEQALSILESGDPQALMQAQMDPKMAAVLSLGPEQIRSILQQADAARETTMRKMASDMLAAGTDPEEVIRRLRSIPVQ